MGNSLIYREEPLLDFKTERGSKSFYKFGASRITGWRKGQEDRLVCIPDFSKDLGLFAVYDGHGGNEVADYLVNNLPNHLAEFLENNDHELALQLAFLNCDHSLRYASPEELSVQSNEENEDDYNVELPNRKSVIPALSALFSGATAGTSKGDGTSEPESLRKCIESETLKFLMSSELEPEESDEDDVSYDESMENSESGDSGSNKDSDLEDSGDDDDEDDSTSDIEDSPKQSTSNKKLDGQERSTPHNEKISTSEEQPNSDAKQDEMSDPKSQGGLFVGSTATVVLLNENKVFIANVGDSRCIASLNGKAIELSVDHKPDDKEEFDRIVNAGSKVTKDGRIDGGLNMSRAFGDFSHKKNDDTLQPIICDPHITSIDVTKDLDYIIIASDGIWNSINNQDIVDYINCRVKDAELQDICEELFKFILASDTSGDGTGCDNMSMILIQLNKQSEPFEDCHVFYNEMEFDT